MPFPRLPDLPDDDPIKALQLLRLYLRQVANQVSPWLLLTFSFVGPLIFFLLVRWLLGSEKALSWGSDFVPLIFAAISIIVSIKTLRERYASAVIVSVVIAGLIGFGIIHYSRTHAEDVHNEAITGLQSRIDSVGRQNEEFLREYLAKPKLSTQELEVDRRQGILKALRNQYIVLHNNVSPELLAGTDNPPREWVNRRLHELGENWIVPEPPAKPAPQSAAPPVEEGKVFFNVVIGDDNVTTTMHRLAEDPHLNCDPPLSCYPEDMKITPPIILDFSGRKYRRIFVDVANISSVLVHGYSVQAAVNARESGVVPHGLSIYRAAAPHSNNQSPFVAWNQNEVLDIIPISKSKGWSEFALDVVADDDADRDFRLGFRMYGPNLESHTIEIPFRITGTPAPAAK